MERPLRHLCSSCIVGAASILALLGHDPHRSFVEAAEHEVLHLPLGAAGIELKHQAVEGGLARSGLSRASLGLARAN